MRGQDLRPQTPEPASQSGRPDVIKDMQATMIRWHAQAGSLTALMPKFPSLQNLVPDLFANGHFSTKIASEIPSPNSEALAF